MQSRQIFDCLAFVNNLGMSSTQSNESVPCPCPTLQTFSETTASRDEPNNVNNINPRVHLMGLTNQSQMT